MSAITQQYIDPLNVPSGIDAKQIKRLGFMEGEGRVPDDFNTMGAKEIENLFLNGSMRLSRAYEVPTPKKQHSYRKLANHLTK